MFLVVFKTALQTFVSLVVVVLELVSIRGAEKWCW